MARKEGKGSILFKVIIAALIIILVLVINIPGEIWSEEMEDAMTSWSNMASVHAAYSYYYKLNKHYTNNTTELIQSIKNDSSLIKRVKIVNHTTQLKNSIDKFLHLNLISNLLAISLNIRNINDDLELNKMYFKRYPEIQSEAEELKSKIVKFYSGNENSHFFSLVTSLDSLWELRRGLPNYNLQNAARNAKVLSQKIVNNSPDASFNLLAEEWQSVSLDIDKFLKNVNSTNIVKVTSVVNRVKDFQKDITSSFNQLKKLNIQEIIEKESQIIEGIGNAYQEFLNDFLVTENLAQLSLSENDSILINLNEDNFYAPVNQKPYKVIFHDTLGLTVEDPTLFDELKKQCMDESANLEKLSFLPAFDNYMGKINEIKSYSSSLKEKYKRNLDVRMAVIELDSAISNLKKSFAISSYLQLKQFIETIPSSESFSEIQNQIEPTLTAIEYFIQIYTENFYGALDSAHIDIIKILKQFNGILSGIKNNTDSFNTQIDDLNQSLSQIKKIPSDAVILLLEEGNEGLDKIFMFVSNGIDKPVYGIFHKRIINLGRVYGKTGQKSWEDPGDIHYKYYRNIMQHYLTISK